MNKLSPTHFGKIKVIDENHPRFGDVGFIKAISLVSNEFTVWYDVESHIDEDILTSAQFKVIEKANW